MLNSFPHRLNADQASLAPERRWDDLVQPTQEETALVRTRLNVVVPTRDALEEIESSSRLRVEGDTLYMSAPLLSGTKTDRWKMAPTGFILSPGFLVTIRDAQLDAFDAIGDEMAGKDAIDPANVLVRLLEEAVDRAADYLELCSKMVSDASQAVFFDDRQSKRLSSDTATLRTTMRCVGQAADRASRVRYMFLAIDRMAAFVTDRCQPEMANDLELRLEAVRHDIASLDEFETALSGRIQLLQDAAAGFISIAQNDVVKLLTIVSIVGVPPVLVVGIYGMNFRHMPELDWYYGYPFALALCVASAILPLLWFKWRGWL